jgi:hypothetical protein
MGGGLLQLVAYGAQDAYLSGNPQITFFKTLYKRHTNFAMEAFRVNFNGQAAWGVKHSAVLGRHADLMGATYLEVVLGAGYYNDDQGMLGFNLLSRVELEIGGQLIDRLYGEFMYLWAALTSPYDKLLDLQSMIGSALSPDTTPANDPTDFLTTAGARFMGGERLCNTGSGRPALPNNILYIPLSFFYTKNPGVALPLIALQYHEVRVNVIWNEVKTIAGDFTGKVQPLPPQPVQCALYVDYIYLDTEERRRMAQQSHEYLIEQTQFNEDKSLTSYSNRVDLTFNHPVKELIWVVQPSGYTDCTVARAQQIVRTSGTVNVAGGSGSGPATVIVTALGTSFTSVTVVAVGSAYLVGDSCSANSGFGTVTFTVAAIDAAGGILGVTNIRGAATSGTASNGDTGLRLQPFTYDQAAVFEQWIQINGQDRMDKRYGDYYNKVQRFQHHTGGYALVNQPGVYSYSFALKPEEHQPSGTCNFSRIDTATIVMTLDGSLPLSHEADQTYDVRVYAINYNILRIMSGMGGLAYSN